MIYVDYVDVSQVDDKIYDKLYRAVSAARRQRADRYRFTEDAVRCVVAEALLRYCLSDTCGFCGEPVIEYHQNGKPFIKNAGTFTYNISHSGKWVAVAYSRDTEDGEVGVDVEMIRPDADWEKVSCRFLTGEERGFIFSASETAERAARFARVWTLKESYVKYLGVGLSKGLESFSVDAVTGRVKDASGRIVSGVYLKSYLLDDACLSVCGGQTNVTVRTVEIKGLTDVSDTVKMSFGKNNWDAK